MYRMFTRNWWKMEDGERVPDPSARRTVQGYATDEQDAIKFCQDWNALHEPGKLSNKCEFEEL